MFSRRDLLKSVAAGLAAWLLPRRLFAGAAAPRFHFVGVDGQSSFPVADPVAWALANRDQPILERAAEGLASLSADDRERIIRLVVRRCGLNLVEVGPDRVRVDYWTVNRADLRPFFKERRLTRPEVVVELRERKRETVATATGDDFLYGSRILNCFPLECFQRKWENRFRAEPDDDQQAPWTRSGFAWAGVEDNRIPWMALKSAWRRAEPMICPNCDSPTILTNFGKPQVSFFNRAPRFEHMCPTCRRSFHDETINDIEGWLAASLDPDAQPDFWTFQGRRHAMKTA